MGVCMIDIPYLAETCQHLVHPTVIESIIAIESNGNPNAIAIVGHPSAWQPSNPVMAVSLIESLEQQHLNYSVGLMQINQVNFARFSLDAPLSVSPCTNISVGARILYDCYERAKKNYSTESPYHHMKYAASCYFSGNFHTGFHYPKHGMSYVARFERAYQKKSSSINRKK